jgi:hypothetical protein
MSSMTPRRVIQSARLRRGSGMLMPSVQVSIAVGLASQRVLQRA